MITWTTKVHVDGLTGLDITNFMLAPSDDAYQRWWPGTHLRFHEVRHVPGHVGDVVYFDELVGDRRLRMQAMVVEAVPGERVVWQVRWGVPLPGWLLLELEDDASGVTVTHTLRAGFCGAGRILDPMLRLYFSPRFRTSMDTHAKVEFGKLGELLRAGR